jgi:hypothetical protein
MPSEAHGAKWFRGGFVWDPGVLLSWGHKNHICQVDVQGQRLKLMDGAKRIGLLRTLLDRGLKPTRLDGAIDFIDQGLNICENATGSCNRGELCILRKFSPNDEFTAQGVPMRRLLKLGSRSSPVCGRIYDKGVEQNVGPLGWWERIEIEWKQDRANQVARQLLNPSNVWAERLTALVLGAVEFRIVNGRPELSRRPLADWWASLLNAHQTARVAPAQEDQSFKRWLGWFRESVGPRLLELAATVSAPLPVVVAWLIRGVKPGQLGGTIPAQFRSAFEAAGIATGSTTLK